ncbi:MULTISPECIES: S-layer homology domain-containing protein [Lysinibacillus]|nr:S-layer homology domain-containing protein [Lysinibacillus sphaericus]MEB7451842.1 S-layer homology domain-containing protein [Lysinibacillus sphaericus]QTB23041.1 S-layer homology domain-containing protein [Lysinibacillus sphaericus]
MAKQNKGRKFFAASATAALVASAIVPVASAAQLNDFNKISGYAKEAVQSLVDAGVIQGDANGNFNPLKTISRAEAATIFTNALELEAEGDVNFKDVKADAWYYDAIAATVENGIFEGVSATEFAPNKQLTRSEAAKILVDAFELEGEGDLSEFADASTVKPWAKSYLEIAVANGVIKGSEANGKTNLNPNAPITRQDFAVVFSRTIENVDATPKVDKIEVVDAKTLNVTLSDGTKETVTLEKALEPNKETEVTFKIKDVEYKAKVTYVVTTATAVKSVSATNLKEVVVEFDGKVDKETATDKANYSLKSGKVIKSVKLLDDEKTVVLTLEDRLNNNKVDAVSVSNVKAGTLTISAKNVEFKAVDNEIPTVKEVKSLGTKALKVVFSEPVDDVKQGNFTLDGKAFYGKVTVTGNEVVLTPYSTSALAVGTHSLQVSQIKDFAGFTSLTSTTEFTVVEDKEAPTVTESSATLETLTLTFSEDVDPDSISASKVFWKSGSDKKAAKSVERVEGNKYKYTFEGVNTLPTGSVTVYVEGVKDYSGNTIAADTKVVVSPQVDQTRPEVKKVEVKNSTTLVVTFSKTLGSSAGNKNNYTVLDKDGKVISVKDAVLSNDKKSVTVTLYKELSDGKNTLEVKNVKDNTKLENTMLDYKEVIENADRVAPTMDSKSWNTSQRRVVIKFSEKMDVETLSNYSNYLVDINGQLRSLNSDIANIDILHDGTTVAITFAEKIGNETVEFGTTNSSGKAIIKQLRVLSVKDVAGNVLKEFSENKGANHIDFTNENSSLALGEYKTIGSTKYSAALVDRKTVEIKFNAGIEDVKAGGITLATGSTNTISSIEANGTSTVKVKFDKEINADASNFELNVKFDKLVTLAGDSFTGSDVIKAPTKTVAGNLLDKVAPEVVGDANYATNQADKTILVPFTEELTLNGSSAELAANDFKVVRHSDRKTLTAGSDYTVKLSPDNKGVLITIKAADTTVGGSVYLVDVVENAKYISDLSAAQNFIAAESTRESANVIDFGAATAVTATVSGSYKTTGPTDVEANETLVFTFSSEVDSTLIADLKTEFATVFKPETTNGAADGFTVADTTVSGKTVITVTAGASYATTPIANLGTNGTITISKANFKDKVTGNVPANDLVIDFK